MNRSNLVKRLLFAAWAVPAGWLIINLTFSIIPPQLNSWIPAFKNTAVYPGHILACFLVFFGVSEYLHMLSIGYSRNGFWLVYIWITFQLASYFDPVFSLSARLDTFMLFMLVAIEAFIWGKKSGRWRRASLLFSGTAFMSIAGFSMLSLYGEQFQDIFPSRFSHPLLSQMGIVTVCASIFCCDSAAYFIGSFFGRHHFSSISPRKTIEGSIAGLITAIAVSTAGWLYLAAPSAIHSYTVFFGVILGIIIGIFGQAGDLVVSLMKRYFRVKDASDLIPGHGGILDRFDSVFFATPVVHLFIIFFLRLFA